VDRIDLEGKGFGDFYSVYRQRQSLAIQQRTDQATAEEFIDTEPLLIEDQQIDDLPLLEDLSFPSVELIKGDSEPQLLYSDKARINGLATDRFAEYVVSGAESERVMFFERETGEVRELYRHNVWFGDVVMTPDAKYVVSYDYAGSIKKWDRETNEVRDAYDCDTQITGIAVSSDGRYIVICGVGGVVKVWDDEEQSLVREWNDLGKVSSIALSPDASTFVFGLVDGVVVLFEQSTGEEIRF
ncbi:MAG: hypothetical protein GY706_00735, partial [Bacteroides sp.]|nr:hypothetical protein [Bacteroides sp.]